MEKTERGLEATIEFTDNQLVVNLPYDRSVRIPCACVPLGETHVAADPADLLMLLSLALYETAKITYPRDTPETVVREFAQHVRDRSVGGLIERDIAKHAPVLAPETFRSEVTMHPERGRVAVVLLSCCECNPFLMIAEALCVVSIAAGAPVDSLTDMLESIANAFESHEADEALQKDDSFTAPVPQKVFLTRGGVA
jgi:hypothetical protein